VQWTRFRNEHPPGDCVPPFFGRLSPRSTERLPVILHETLSRIWTTRVPPPCGELKEEFGSRIFPFQSSLFLYPFFFFPLSFNENSIEISFSGRQKISLRLLPPSSEEAFSFHFPLLPPAVMKPVLNLARALWERCAGALKTSPSSPPLFRARFSFFFLGKGPF